MKYLFWQKISPLTAGCSLSPITCESSFQFKVVADFHPCIYQKSIQLSVWNVLHYGKKHCKIRWPISPEECSCWEELLLTLLRWRVQVFFSNYFFFTEIIIFKCLFCQVVFYIDDIWTGKVSTSLLAFIKNSVTVYRLSL